MASNSTRKRQLVDWSASNKKKICEVHKTLPTLNHEEFAQYMVSQHGSKFVDRTTISKIVRAEEKWLTIETSAREGSVQRAWDEKWPQLKKSLVLWFGYIRALRGLVTDDVLVRKVDEVR